MRTLYARLAAALLLIVVSLGLTFFFISRWATGLYYQEVTQRLNADIAAHIADEETLIRDNQVDSAALKTIAHLAMVINPSVEVYLLDPQGRIIGHDAPPGAVAREAVALGPVRAFDPASARLPLLGDDPRDPTRRKIFSAAQVHNASGEPLGYVYVILGGEKYDALVDSVAHSYILKLSVGAIAVSLVLALLVGLLTMGLLTRRLRRLTAQVTGFAESGFHSAEPVPVARGRQDELDQLGAAFNAMSARIADQVTRLEETDRLRKELITNVSHDLRTPLASMQGYIETLLIKDETLSVSQRRQYLAIARDHGERLGQLIGELFDLARLDAGSVEPHLEGFSLPELLQDVSQEFQLQAGEKQIELRIEPPAEPAYVFADIGLIQRVLENLMENALRYTPGGGSVTVSLRAQPDRVGVTVADTGCGIAPEAIPHIFDRFYRSAPDESEDSGAGLGLAIVKKIIDLHGGQIVVESRPQAGTRFTFDLPAYRAAA